MLDDVIGNFKDLDFDNIDFSSPFWSWSYAQEDDIKCAEIVYCDYDGNVTRYPIPHFLIKIIERVKEGSLNRLKEELTKLDESRKLLLSCTYKTYE